MFTSERIALKMQRLREKADREEQQRRERAASLRRKKGDRPFRRPLDTTLPPLKRTTETPSVRYTNNAYAWKCSVFLGEAVDGKVPCDICERPLMFEEAVSDHNHFTDLIRGILCDSCNSALGLFRENPAFLQAALDYLEEHTSPVLPQKVPQKPLCTHGQTNRSRCTECRREKSFKKLMENNEKFSSSPRRDASSAKPAAPHPEVRQ